MNMNTINAQTGTIAAIHFAIMGGKFLILLDNENDRFGDVIDSDGNIIGSAHEYASGSGWAVHTRQYAGWVEHSQIVKIVK